MCYRIGTLFGLIISRNENAFPILSLFISRKDGNMRTLIPYLMILCLLFPLLAHDEEKETPPNVQDSAKIEREYVEEEYTNEDEYNEDEYADL